MYRRRAEDVLRCRVCEKPEPSLLCDICGIYIYKSCVGEHLLDQSKEQREVAFEKQGLKQLNVQKILHSFVIFTVINPTFRSAWRVSPIMNIWNINKFEF